MLQLTEDCLCLIAYLTDLRGFLSLRATCRRLYFLLPLRACRGYDLQACMLAKDATALLWGLEAAGHSKRIASERIYYIESMVFSSSVWRNPEVGSIVRWYANEKMGPEFSNRFGSRFSLPECILADSLYLVSKDSSDLVGQRIAIALGSTFDDTLALN